MNEISENTQKLTKLCRHCKMEIPQDAKICPYCHKKQKRSILKWILIAILVLFLLFCAFCAIVIGIALKQTSQPNGASVSQSTAGTISEPASDDSVEINEETAVTDGIRPEFKEAMDSYEAFFDEYVEFMNQYAKSESTPALLLEYSEFLTQYSETMQKMEEWESGELSKEETLYYIEVTGRINQKLASAAVQIQ